jgi:hypothetical protein
MPTKKTKTPPEPKSTPRERELAGQVFRLLLKNRSLTEKVALLREEKRATSAQINYLMERVKTLVLDPFTAPIPAELIPGELTLFDTAQIANEEGVEPHVRLVEHKP